MIALDLFRRTRRPAGLHAADAPTERIPRQSAPEAQQDEPHGIATPATLAALVARAGASGTGQPAAPTLPYTLDAAQWRGAPDASEVIPFVPLTVGALIYDGMGGGEKTARDCAHCGALGGREDWSWRYDALTKWSCPSCQAQPEWHAPSLPGLRVTTPQDNPGGEEAGIMARSLLATNQRCVRQRPDGSWVAAVPIEGRIKPVGPFGSEGEAVAAYGYVLAAFAGAAGAESAA